MRRTRTISGDWHDPADRRTNRGESTAGAVSVVNSYAPSDACFNAIIREFAGTLMLGRFRGLACDMLWVRADTAQEEGKFYESQALFGIITRIQPGFVQIWSYLSWNMAYNVAPRGRRSGGRNGPGCSPASRSMFKAACVIHTVNNC